MVAADFGCGSGFWAIPLSRILEDGKVFAIDILEGPLFVLASKAKSEKILNIRTVRENIEKGTKISQDSCDLVLMTNLLFQCDEKKAVFSEAKRILKKGGRILVVDWKKSDSFGPRDRAVLPEEVKKIADDLGLKVEKQFDAGIYHYGLILVK